MNYLLDTCVISEFAKPVPDNRVIAFVVGRPDSVLSVSALSFGEIWKGILLLPEGRRKKGLTDWFAEIQNVYADRVLPILTEEVLCWAEYHAQVHRSGGRLTAIDGLIAATAQVHQLTLVTRNTRDFEGLGLPLLNPWE